MMKKIFIALFIAILTSCAGSYYYAERYLLDMSRQELIDSIKKFKSENPKYKSIVMSKSGEEKEYPEDEEGDAIIYSFYFYLPEKDMIVHCALNMSDQIKDNPANFMLTAVTKNKNLGGGKRINTKELSKEENKEIKTIFETKILDKLGKWKRRGNINLSLNI